MNTANRVDQRSYNWILTGNTLVFDLFVVGLVGATETPVNLEIGARLFTFTVTMNDGCKPPVGHGAVARLVPETMWAYDT